MHFIISITHIAHLLLIFCITFVLFQYTPDEPGYKRNASTAKESIAYNMDTRRSTVRAAYLDHLTHPDPYFGDIIRDMMTASWDKTKGVFERWGEEEKSSMGRGGPSITENIAAIEEQLLKNTCVDAKKAK